MELLGGEDMAFPSELIAIKKSKGSLYPIFLSAETSSYADSLLSAFHSYKGKKRGDIEKLLRNMELGFQNHKVFRSISLILLRKSVFEPPSGLPAEDVRAKLFTMAHQPVYIPEDRVKVISRVAESLGVEPAEVENGIYADKETEQVLSWVPDLTPDDLCLIYNQELVESILLKAVSMKIWDVDSWISLVREIKRNYLMYEAFGNGGKVEYLRVDGPLSQMSEIERYGSRFSSLFHSLTSFGRWKIEAEISLKDRFKSKERLKLSLDDSSSAYFPQHIPQKIASHKEPWIISLNPSPVMVEKRIFFPDIETDIAGKHVFVDISAPSYLESNRERDQIIRKAGILWETVYTSETRNHKIRDALVFDGEINYSRLFDYLKNRYSPESSVEARRIERTEKLEEEMDPEQIEEIARKVQDLYPDADRIVEYIESKGFVAQRVLRTIGYKLKWDGLTLVIYK